MTRAGSVAAAYPADQRAGSGATPTPALQRPATFGPKDIDVRPIPHGIARKICQQKHYLKSFPGGSVLSFGVFAAGRLLGVLVLGVGPSNLHRYFEGAAPEQVMCLSRLWLDDRLGRNSESRTLAIVMRHLRRHQDTIKAVVAYADPDAGHVGVVYRGAGFLFIGWSEATPLYQLPDGSVHHSRSLSHAYGTHSLKHFSSHGVQVKLVPQSRKLVYAALIDPTWQQRLRVPMLPYPK